MKLVSRGILLSCCLGLAFAAASCTAAGVSTRRDGGRSADGSGPRIIDGCDNNRDTDGDGVADQAEGDADLDGDGLPNFRDTDSDNDGISDGGEHGGNIPCALPDADDDNVPNWADTDSDNDGLSDRDERERYSTDPYDRDTDGDDVTDLGEVLGTMTDPNDASSTIAPEDFFVVLPYEGEMVMRTLRFNTNLQLADVYFLIDTTGSMQSAIDNVTQSLSSISAQVSTRIPNVQMGVGQFRDFPMPSEGFGAAYGNDGDAPYTNMQDITADLSAVQSALQRLQAGGGGDTPESSTEGLYQTATGEGGTWRKGSVTVTLPRKNCPAAPDEDGRRRGYPCFRPGSLPIIVHVTDAPFHNGPSNAEPYAGIIPAPHTFDQAVTALNGIGARFLGVAVGAAPRAHEEVMAMRTGSVDTSNRPLVYDAAGGTVSDAIVQGIETIAGRTPQDVDTEIANQPGNPDNFDARGFIKAITPVEGYNGANSGAQPGVTYTRKDETTFYAVVPGTVVEFAVRFYNDVRRPAESAQIFRATIIVRGNRVAHLDRRNVYIVVPPDGAIVLI